jgi:hypothetical protein
MPGKYTLGQASEGHDLTLPSGATCRARRPGSQGLIDAGLLDSFDELTSLVKTEHLDRGKKITAADTLAAVESFSANKDKFHSALLLMDRLAVAVVIQPKVWIDYQLIDETDAAFNKRKKAAADDHAIPVRLIELEDKSFLLQWAIGGSSDLKSFREGSEELMADVVASQEVQLPTE